MCVKSIILALDFHSAEIQGMLWKQAYSIVPRGQQTERVVLSVLSCPHKDERLHFVQLGSWVMDHPPEGCLLPCQGGT